MSTPLPPHLAPYLTLNLFQELGVQTWPPEEQSQFLERLGEVIHLRLIKKIVTMLNEEQKIRLETLLSQDQIDDRALQMFLQMEVPSFDDMIAEIIAEYKKELVDKYQAIAAMNDKKQQDT